MRAERTPRQHREPFGSLPGCAESVELRPGQVALADWRAIYAGAPVSLDFVSRADVEAGAAAMAALVASGASSDGGQAAAPLVAQMIRKSGDKLPGPLVRLFVALKLTSLAQGGSGVRWEVIDRLSACIAGALLPSVPADAGGDRQALSHVLAMLTGTGDVLSNQRPGSAAKALKKVGLAPLRLNDAERQALLSGSHLSLALALSGLFEAECLLQSALVTEALAIARSGEAGAFASLYHRRGHQADAAAALHTLLGQPRRSTPATFAVPSGDAHRIATQTGACLDILRHAGAILEREANTPSEGMIVVWQTGEVIQGEGETPAMSVAADLVARALGETARMAERSVADLGAASDAAPTDPPGLMSSLAAQIRDRVAPVSSAVEEETNRVTAAVERLRPLAGSVALVIAILALAASRAETKRSQPGSEPDDILDGVRRLLRDRLPDLSETACLSAAEVAAAAELVRSGALAAAPGFKLPNADPPTQTRPPRRHTG